MAGDRSGEIILARANDRGYNGGQGDKDDQIEAFLIAISKFLQTQS
jgi:hypothetical protein